ncbi:integrin alpha-3b [Denticeps clupeoides]|uniref:Integrin alpha-2 domain-containing protein n=1 Tax=Denticeps clupeoides TaxID=299321 RepID=A0AAY4A4E0_9TELE|nr:integrin alpha-3-like [Denticeps clupeoides]
MAPPAPPALLLLLLCCAPDGRGFNLDVRFPVVKEGGTPGSLFGFSVAQHEQTRGSRRYLLLAGAPKEKALPRLKVNETGALYSCPISTDPSDCSRVDIIGSVDSSEMVEGMWLGVTVASQRQLTGGRVLACGHRYAKNVWSGFEEEQRMVGRCFVRGNDLTFDRFDEWQTHTYTTCNSAFDFRQEGMCNLGISGGMTETDVYLGSTGSYTWQGNVHVTWRNPDPANSWDSNVRAFEPLETKRYSYMGYSVLEETRLLSRDESTVVTGSPRDDSKGSVTLAKKDKTLVPVLTVQGEQVGSYFGSSIAVTDLNNDGWNDLIVGAPFYFDRKNEKGGAVYVFMNENGSFQPRASMVLTGPVDSGFGLTVAAIGDVNQDGFQDFAVGAPFHGSGKVFVWMGSVNGISTKPSQVIEGSEVGAEGFRTFGYSLSGGMDMDGNKYPDVLVGSLDDRVALLRARPVIHLSRNFTVEPKTIDPSDCVDNRPCVTVRVCFSYTLSNGNTDFKRDVNLLYTVDSDKNRRISRVRFLANKMNSYTGSLSISSARCEELPLTINEPVKNKLDPVVFTLNVSLQEQKAKARRALQNLDSFPVLSDKEHVVERSVINFKKECGDDNQCFSNLRLRAQFADDQFSPFPRHGEMQVMEFEKDTKKLALIVVVTNLPEPGRQAEDAHQALLNITFPPALQYAAVRAQDIECHAEDTLSFVICELGNPFKSKQNTTMQLIFETSGITLYTDTIDLLLQLSTLSVQNDLDPVQVGLKVENKIAASFSIEKPVVWTYFSGAVKGESAMNTTSDVGSQVEFRFKVEGPEEPLGSLGTLVVEFEWPYEVASGKWLLYLTEIVTRGTSEAHCTPPGQVVNLLNLTLSEEKSRRLRRDVVFPTPQSVRAQAVSLLPVRKESFELECSKGTARCVTFSCPLLNMSRKAEVIVRSRVWNSTMLEDYINALTVTVKGSATLKLATDKPTIRMDSVNRQFLLNVDPVLRKETPYEVPLWVFIVAALAGVLLLGIISLILWKCGFFRRASRREMYEAKAQKAEIKIQPSETEWLTEDY